MDCPKCKSPQSKKNGFRRGKQSYRCKKCGTQYVANPSSRAYSPQIKQTCIEMYLNGMGIRGISRVTRISHPTILNWIQEAGKSLSDEPQDEEIPQRGDGGQLEFNSSFRAPEITEIDELQTFVGNKKNKYWVWTVVNHKKKGIILWTIGDRSDQTFTILWSIIRCWHSFWYVTDGWKVYPMYIESEDHLVSKTYMTRVEGENTRLRHCARGAHRHCFAMANRHTSIARLHRKTLCYSKSLVFLKYSIRLLLHYLRFETVPAFA